MRRGAVWTLIADARLDEHTARPDGNLAAESAHLTRHLPEPSLSHVPVVGPRADSQFYNDPAVADPASQASRGSGNAGPRGRGRRPGRRSGRWWRGCSPTGKPIFGEDMEVTLERGRGPEVAYFTFSYSAVHDEAGLVAGMLATALETTRRLKAEQSQRESARRFTREGAGGGPVLRVPRPVRGRTDALHRARAAGVHDRRGERGLPAHLDDTSSEIMGRNVSSRCFRTILPRHTRRASGRYVRRSSRSSSSRRPDVMGVLRYPIRLPPEQGGGFVQRWWSSMNTPVLGPDGEVALIIPPHRGRHRDRQAAQSGEAHDQVLRDQQALIDRLRSTEATLRRNRTSVRNFSCD